MTGTPHPHEAYSWGEGWVNMRAAHEVQGEKCVPGGGCRLLGAERTGGGTRDSAGGATSTLPAWAKDTLPPLLNS